MKNLNIYIKESLLDDEDVLMKDNEYNVLEKYYTDWLMSQDMNFISVKADKNGINIKGELVFKDSTKLPPPDLKLNYCDSFYMRTKNAQRIFDNQNYLPNITNTIFIADHCNSTIHDWSVKASKLYIGESNKIGKNFKIDIVDTPGLQLNIGRIKLNNINEEKDFGGLKVKNKSNSYLQLNLSGSPITEKIITAYKKERKLNGDSYQTIINCINKFINLNDLEKRFEKLFCIIFKCRDLESLKINHFYAGATPKRGDLVLYKVVGSNDWRIFRKTL